MSLFIIVFYCFTLSLTILSFNQDRVINKIIEGEKNIYLDNEQEEQFALEAHKEIEDLLNG